MRLRFLLLYPVLLAAQQQPLPVEPASVLNAGEAAVSLGAGYLHDQPFPLSGLSGDLARVGTLRFSIAVSEYAEMQLEGTLLTALTVRERRPAFNAAVTTTNDRTADIGDFTVWTKFTVLQERRHGLTAGMRLGVQMPNASNESGLGVDEMNFYSVFLFEKSFTGRLLVNAGLAIYSDPARLGSQHDMFVYGAEYRHPVSTDASLYVQAAGRDGHTGPGVPRLATLRAGAELSRGPLSARFAGILNSAPSDKARGAELTLTYRFTVIDMKETPCP